MRKVLLSLASLFLMLTISAQDVSLTANKIIENGTEYYLYEVQESEGFMAIGRKFGLAYQDIIEVNKETTKDGLKPGQVLRIPVVKGRNSNNTEVKSENFIYHKVSKGENVFFISRKYGVSYNDIYTNNPGSKEVLSIGQELKIPKVTQDTTIKASNENTYSHTEPLVDGFQYHTVQPKESATGIARKYGITLHELADANPGIEANKLTIGDKLRIPEKKENTTIETTKELIDTDYTYHRIQSGETLESIATLYNIPSEVIIKINPSVAELPPVLYRLQIPHSYQFEIEKISENLEIYIVKKKDDIRDIATLYQVPIMNIKAANPHVSKWTKLKKGTELIIPTLSIEKVDSMITRVPADSENQDLLDYFENQKTSLGDTINVAFVWPLYLAANDTLNIIKKVNSQTGITTYESRNPKSIYPSIPYFREFYYGTLIAINDLKEKGLVVNIKNYDTEKGLIKILKVLEDETLSSADIIFGPGFNDQIEPLADFCLENHIRLVVPFSPECKKLESNPYMYQVLPSKGIEYSYTAKEVANRYSKSNIIMIKGNTNDKREALIGEFLKSELYNPDSIMSRQISYKEISFNKDRMSGLSALLSKEKHNLIIIPEKTDKLYTLVIPVMENYISRHEDIEIKLLGFGEWQEFKGIELENIYNVGCELYTPLYADFDKNAVNINNFKTKYYDYFVTTPREQYPYYSMLGYDVANYFLKGLHIYGNELENNLGNINQHGLCVDFDFERINNWGGFVNKKIYTVEYTNDFDIKLVK